MPEEATTIEAPPKTAPDAAPPDQPPPPKTTPSAPPTDNRSFIERMTGRKPADKKAETPTAPAPPGATPPVAPPKPGAKPKAKAPTAAPEPIDYDRLAEAAGRGAAKAITETQPAKKEKHAPDDGLTEDQRETVSVLERMGKDYPQYVNLAKEFSEASKRAKDYQAKWESANPGHAFDPEADEHNEFFEKNDVDWNDAHFNRAIARIEAEKAAEKATAKSSEKLSELESKDQLRESEPKVRAQSIATARDYFKELGADYVKVLNDDGSINREEIKRLTDEDPVRQAVFEAAHGVEGFAAELHRLTLVDPKGRPLYAFNKDNPNHQFIAQFVQDEEAAMKALPAEDQASDGKRFATADEYAAMTPEKRRHYWRYTDRDLSRIYAAREAQRVQALVENESKRLEEFATKRGWKKPEGDKQPTASTAKNGEIPAQATEKPISPAGISEQPLARTSSGGRPGNKDKTSTFLERFLGRG